MREQTLLGKIRSLRPERVAELEDLDILSKLDFNLAFPMVNLTYIAPLFVCRFLFNELFTRLFEVGPSMLREARNFQVLQRKGMFIANLVVAILSKVLYPERYEY